MKVSLCYKEYSFKINLKACKEFYDLTGLDLQTVFLSYICASVDSQEMSISHRLLHFSKLYSRDIACKALYCVIKQGEDGVSLEEIQDATFRVSWIPSERQDDQSEPWPIVMLMAALEINDYFSKELGVKKSDTSEPSAKDQKK